MLYKNKKTGAVIDVASQCEGDWEPVEEKEPKETKKKKDGKQ